MQTPLVSSAWSTEPIDSKATKGHHLDGLARWLQRAGAEPRLALALCSGPRARAPIYAHLTKAGVNIVPVPVSSARPIHGDLMAHQGTHFDKDAAVFQRRLRRTVTLFGIHGYPDWAEDARAKLESDG